MRVRILAGLAAAVALGLVTHFGAPAAGQVRANSEDALIAAIAHRYYEFPARYPGRSRIQRDRLESAVSSDGVSITFSDATATPSREH
jgi:hypothetical protein